MKFTDKTVVVTGGATGIGRAMCLRFALEGAAVVINYNQSKTHADELVGEIEGSGGRALAVQADVSRDQETRRLIAQSVEHYGRLDLLINNAGWTRFVPHHDLESLSDEVLDNTWGVIVKGSIYCIRAAVPHLKAAGNASIINTTSIAAYTARGSSLMYVAAKSALAGVTKALARALAPEIRVNAIAPGFVDTGFVNWAPEVLDELQKPTRLGNRISPEDVADAAVYLAADAKSTTGQTILVDAGDTALGQ
jgi:3-oxoacyl-[acyl-carrier protein] reductase